VNWRSTTSGQGREMALQILPLRIRKVTGITGTHPASLSHELSSALSKTRSKRYTQNRNAPPTI
jgi:hypothetical protein